MAKSTHKQSSNNKKTYEEYRGIILSIIDCKYEINISEIKRIVKPSGAFHMAGNTVERIISELKEEEKIDFREIGNEKCYYLSAE